jgi:uncharacterized protein
MTNQSSQDALALAASPVEKKDRILFLDAVRGIALLGILLMNSMAQGQAHQFYAFLNLNQPITGKNYYAWVLEMGFFEGTMRGLFSLLFGAGTYLLVSRLEKTRGHIDAADIYYRRILWLLFFGVVNAFIFFWPGDILYPYALCGLVLFPFRNLSAKKLWIIALLLVVFGTYRETRMLYDRKETIAKGKQVELLQKQHKKLTDEQKGDLKKWEKFRDKNTSKGFMKEAMAEEKQVKNADYLTLFAFFRDVNMELQSIGFYNGWWDMLSLFFIGIALIKSKFLTGEKSNWFYAFIALFGIGLAIAFNFMGIKEMYAAKFDMVKLTESAPAELYQIRRLIQTLGYLSLFILLYKITPFRKILNIFVPVGQMAFSNYLMQSIITSIFFYGMGWYGYLQRYQLYEVVLSIWIFQIIFSHIWLRYFLFGPFEWLWRSLTYKKLQPFKKP